MVVITDAALNLRQTSRTSDFNPTKKELYTWYHIEGKTYQEIATINGCSVDTVGRRMKAHNIKSRPKSDYMIGNNHSKGSKNHRWDGGNDQYWKQVLVDKYGHKCQVCSFDVVVQVHHIDENRQNNNLSNLVLLCPNCHFSIHHANYNLMNEDNKWLLLPIQL